MLRWLRELVDFVRDVLPEGLRRYVEHEAFVWILFGNLLAAAALFAAFDADAQTITEFGSFSALAALCAAVAEFDVVQKWAGRETLSSGLGWAIMLPIVAFALAVGVWMHTDRVGAERMAVQSQEQREAFNAQLRSPEVQEGLRLMKEIAERRAATTTRPATNPATRQTADEIGS
jgi:hypothetical protein